MSNEEAKTTDLKCNKHPTYKAVRKPTADCATCREMYATRGKD